MIPLLQVGGAGTMRAASFSDGLLGAYTTDVLFMHRHKRKQLTTRSHDHEAGIVM